MTHRSHVTGRGGPRRPGKRVGSRLYVHRAYEHVLPAGALRKAKEALPRRWDYVVVRYDSKQRSFAFIACPDFDDAPEPTVGDSYLVKSDSSAKFRRAPYDCEIYHHKWLLVADDYPGFDVADAKVRSATWQALDEVDKSRIGRKSYWQTHVLPRLRLRSSGNYVRLD